MAENPKQNLQPAAVIARIYGSDVRRIQQLNTAGIIKGQGRPAMYDLLPTVQALFEYQRKIIQGKEKSAATEQLEAEKLQAEKRIKTAKAEMAEFELKELKGELHRASDVEAITTDHVMFVRSMIMALPGKLAVDLAAIQSAPEAAERIKQEAYSILDRLANYRYDPDEYKKRVMERQGWNERHSDEGDE